MSESAVSSPVSIDVDGETTVSGLLTLPHEADWLYVLAHGAGAGMHHPFLDRLAGILAARRIGTLRYQFPFMEAGRRRPDPPGRAVAAVRAAVRAASRLVPGLAVVAGGKSFGARMTSTAQAEEPLPGVRALVCVGFPLHPPGRPGRERATHLSRIRVPMLLLQGTRDRLADLAELRPVVQDSGGRVTLHVVEGGDHGFGVLKRSGRTAADVLDELGDTIRTWIDEGQAVPPRTR